MLSPVRVVGDGTAVIDLDRACMFIMAPLVVLENLRVDRVEWEPDDDYSGCDSDYGGGCGDEGIGPAIQVSSRPIDSFGGTQLNGFDS